MFWGQNGRGTCSSLSFKLITPAPILKDSRGCQTSQGTVVIIQVRDDGGLSCEVVEVVEKQGTIRYVLKLRGFAEGLDIR